MAASEQVHFSPDNNSVNFSPLLREDGGLYQCLVLEGGNSSKLVSRESGTPIQSVGYLLQVNCEYTRVMKFTLHIVHFQYSEVDTFANP